MSHTTNTNPNEQQAVEQDLINHWSNPRFLPRTKIGVIGYTSAGKSCVVNRLLGVSCLTDDDAAPVRTIKSTYYQLQFDRQEPLIYPPNRDIKIPVTFIDIQGLDKDRPTVNDQIEAGNYLDEIRKADCDIYILVFDDQLRYEQEGWINYIELTLGRKCVLVRSKVDICYLKKFRELANIPFGRSTPEQRSQYDQRIIEQIRYDNQVELRQMPFWKKDPSKKELYTNVTEGLRQIYKTKLLPLEEAYRFHEFHSSQLDDSDFAAKPMVLLVGQYSVGKTTFIRYLLNEDFPGIRIGPEPTTDSFIAIMHNENPGVVPGNALVVDPTKPFRPLSKFGNAFLNRFVCSQIRNEILETITFVDTPGILAGEKQRVDRGYEFSQVLEWFADRCDRILLLFDVSSLDISDELKRAIEVLRRNDDKIRIVLNKADSVDQQALMRVYGALMWSLGKVLNTPEVCRVYVGSFWSKALTFDTNRRLFELETKDLFNDLESLPRTATLRKLNDLIKRARLARVHALIISELKEQMPSVFGKDSKRRDLLNNLHLIYEKIEREQNIPMGDFPKLDRMQEILRNMDFTKFRPLDRKILERVDRMLSDDVPKLMGMIPQEEQAYLQLSSQSSGGQMASGNTIFSDQDETPFAIGGVEGINAGIGECEWIVERSRHEYDQTFLQLSPQNGKVTGASAKQEMIRSKLPNNVLGRIWKLSDIDKDGMLDIDEWALSQHLIKLKVDGHELPNVLPDHLIPPSKRHLTKNTNNMNPSYGNSGVYPTLGNTSYSGYN
ncbi:unnamed protein product [Rotaria sordida]|uniref:Uncharacterized protein n=1 Tax=Rotaria sordida TaxID=392033 RepID=A0A815HWB4_9BILA|nr:unnamed protein product [Rotaria sordida]CAF1357191.1 unnamed protein product [Rotaria sordida]